MPHRAQTYYHQGEAFHGYLAYKNTQRSRPRPAVLVVHDWSGCNDFAREKAQLLASLGYVGFAVDMFGQGRVGETVAEKSALIQPLLAERHKITERMQAALTFVRELANVDTARIAAIGFCFGGLCVLDLVRSGIEIAGVVSFHGLLGKPETLTPKPIKARVLALHGYDDPMVAPQDVMAFCDEMTGANVDWQMQMYGQTQHAFTNPKAHDLTLGTVYNARAEKRALQSMQSFLQDLFQ